MHQERLGTSMKRGPILLACSALAALALMLMWLGWGSARGPDNAAAAVDARPCVAPTARRRAPERTAQLHGLDPGRYTLRAFPDDVVFDPPAIEVAPPLTTVEIRWRSR